MKQINSLFLIPATKPEVTHDAFIITTNFIPENKKIMLTCAKSVYKH